MRKVLLLFAAVCCVLTAQAWDLKVDGICYNVNWSDETAVVTYETKGSDNYKNLSGEIKIPKTVRGDLTDFTVVAIGDSAFRNASNIIYARVYSSLTSIGIHAFAECTKLTYISLPSTLTTLERAAFAHTAITTIDLPNQLQTIGRTVFSGCKDLVSIRIPESVTSIGSSAFDHCTSLNSIVLPASCPTIGSTCFHYCTALNLIINYAVTPQDIPTDSFLEIPVPEAITLRVPYGSKQAYLAVAGWKLLHIEELPNPNEGIEQPISDSSLKGGEKFLRDGQLFIEKNGKVFNALGTEIK